MKDHYGQLMAGVASTRTALLSHPVYTKLNSPASLRTFMESHAFAVWDFMSLVKTLQYRTTCVLVPWLPPKNPALARYINEIVLRAESDEVLSGCYISHFELYLKAMKEAGAPANQIRYFIYSLKEGIPPSQAIASLDIPKTTKAFVLQTLEITNKSTHEVAAALVIGREAIIPDMFKQILQTIEKNHSLSLNSFKLYLHRHIYREQEQASCGEQLLKNICGDDPSKWEQATFTAFQVLIQRHSLWDGIVNAMETQTTSTSLQNNRAIVRRGWC